MNGRGAISLPVFIPRKAQQHAQRNSEGRKTRAQIVPKIDWLEATAKHEVWWATRSWKLCTRSWTLIIGSNVCEESGTETRKKQGVPMGESDGGNHQVSNFREWERWQML